MTSPAAGGPATVEAVAGWLGIPRDSTGDREREHVETVVPAVNAFVRSVHGDGELAADIVQGSIHLAARIIRRRNSPSGVEAFGELGGATYVSRYDADLDRLLRLGAYRRIVVG